MTIIISAPRNSSTGLFSTKKPPPHRPLKLPPRSGHSIVQKKPFPEQLNTETTTKWNRATINSSSPVQSSSSLQIHLKWRSQDIFSMYLRTVTNLASRLSTISTRAVILTLIVVDRSVMVRSSLFRSMKMSLAINTNEASCRRALLSVLLVTASNSLSSTGVWWGTLSTDPPAPTPTRLPLFDVPSWPSVTSFPPFLLLLLCGVFRAMNTGLTTRCTKGMVMIRCYRFRFAITIIIHNCTSLHCRLHIIYNLHFFEFTHSQDHLHTVGRILNHPINGGFFVNTYSENRQS